MTIDPTFIAFGAAFGAGPAIYAVLQRLTPHRLTLLLLGGCVAVGIVAAFAFLGQRPVVSLLCLWLAWVCAISLLVLALRRRALSPRTRRTSFVTGLLATTLPWFGLATARMVAS